MGAEDATQETFQRVHKHLATVPEGREGLFWIYRVATNYCLNEIRNRKLRPTATDPAITDAFSIDDASVFENRTAVRQLINRAAPKLRSVA